MVLGGAALLLFGPEQFPKVARKAGSFVRDMQTTSQSFIREIERAADVHDTPPAHHEDLISTGSGAGPQPSPFAGTVQHEPVMTAASHDDDLPGFASADDGAWGSAESYGPDESEAGPLGLGSAIDPSATLILTEEGDVRHSVDASDHVRAMV